MNDNFTTQAEKRPILRHLRPDPGASLLAPDEAAFDVWFDAVRVQRFGCVSYSIDDDGVYGCAEIARTEDMQAAAYCAYADLFQVLGNITSLHLLRLWNYFPRINDENGGVERYRQFNAGRQQAFIDARRGAFEGSPAACALGTQMGPLRVYFLAGHKRLLALENPRQVSAYHYPSIYGTSSPTFSRAVLVDLDADGVLLFISGTASIVGHETVHIGDVRRQTEETLTNLAAVREVAAERAGTPFLAEALTYTLYLRHPADLAVVREVFEAIVGAASRAALGATYLQADICRRDLLVEIEATGVARAVNATKAK